MAHSHQGHREHSKSRSRAGHILKSGGDHHPHAHKDKGLLSHSFREHEGHPKLVHGYARGGRIEKYARGGKADKKHHTQVNIAVVAPHRGEASGGAGAAPGGAAMPSPRPPMAGGPAAPPGLPPGMAGGPPGMPPPGAGGPPGAMPPRPPMKRGGAVKRADGGAADDNQQATSQAQQPANPYNAAKKRGGAVKKFARGGYALDGHSAAGPTKPAPFAPKRMIGGGDSGVGRKNKAKHYGGSKANPKI